MSLGSVSKSGSHYLLSTLSRTYLFRSSCVLANRRRMSLNGFDQEQVRLMAEQCILVDENDKVLGPDSKKSCHLNVNIDAGKLHRAFSVFLFNEQGKLLLQQRSKAKITFPEYYANTCCSHPLYRAEELEEEDQIGVRRAAQRKLNHELGIPLEQVPPSCFTFLTRIQYKARSCTTWGEHEIDYILFTQRDVDLLPNSNEVLSCQYVDRAELEQLLNKNDCGEVKVSPWFKMICDNFLQNWWDNLDDLTSVSDPGSIHRLS